MEGLTDKQQAALSIASAICIAVGSISVPATGWWGVAVAVIGAVGFGIKEALGGKQS